MADRWIELFDVETDEAELLLVFDRFEPVDYGCGVFPLVEVVFFRDCAVDAVEDVFADFAYLGLRGVDESAGWFVCEFRLVILKCYECVFVGCSVHSVVDSQFCRDGSASISGSSKTTTSNTLFPGAFSHRTRRTTAQAKDVTSASKKNF